MIATALLACAINVAPSTMEAVIRVEHGSPVAINVNHLTGQRPKPATVQEAIATARHYISLGYTVDMGWSQLNSANLPRFGYTVEDAFDPCKNISAGGAVLAAFYGQAVQRFGEGQPALAAALSAYNTGDMQKGFLNGYVGKYFIKAAEPNPQRKRNPGQQPTYSPPAFTTIAYDRPGLDLCIN